MTTDTNPCPANDGDHRWKFNGGNPVCSECYTYRDDYVPRVYEATIAPDGTVTLGLAHGECQTCRCKHVLSVEHYEHGGGPWKLVDEHDPRTMPMDWADRMVYFVTLLLTTPGLTLLRNEQEDWDQLIDEWRDAKMGNGY